jgi:hypothetical protein
MNDFFEYLESKGIKDIRDLTAFVHNFFQDPSIFFDFNLLCICNRSFKWTGF